MSQKNDFRTIEFFRKVRDEQAAMLDGKNHEDITGFFSSFSECSDSGKVPDMSHSPSGNSENDMRSEYEFSGGVRGKHACLKQE